MNKKAISQFLVFIMVISLINGSVVKSKSKEYLIKSLSKKYIMLFNYKWDWNNGYTPKGKVKIKKITGKTKFYLADPDASLADEGTPVRVSLRRMKKEIRKYRKQGWHMLALIKYKDNRIISVTEQIQDW